MLKEPEEEDYHEEPPATEIKNITAAIYKIGKDNIEKLKIFEL